MQHAANIVNFPENHKAIKPEFDGGSQSTRQQNAI